MNLPFYRSTVAIFCIVVLLSTAHAQISINTTSDSVYVFDDFTIAGELLNDYNGVSGTGWAGNWLYQGGKTSGVAVGDGYIYSTADGFGVQRELTNPIRFVGSTFYVSFLFKKEPTGEFRISGNRFSDNVDRFGIHISKEGKLGAQAGVSYQNTVFSENSFVENDKTYLVVAKYYYTDKPNMNISVFEDDASIPSGEPIDWDLEVAGVSTGMEAIEYFRLAFTSASVCLDEFKLGDTWQSVNGTDIDTGIPQIEPNQVVDSDVFVIDPELNDQIKSWTYFVEEDGNYQLGYSWIWVYGDNTAADLNILVNDDTIRMIRATSEIAPYRFETRLENLKKGDQVKLTATPEEGASFYLSSRLSFATPTFSGVAIFDVQDYGAVGDGVTNDYDAIIEACDAAMNTGGGVVQFDGSKEYRIIGPKGYTLFNLKNTKNVKIQGNGARLILHPNGNFASVKYSENIQIEGLSTTYDPLPYYQGQITRIDVPGLYLDMTVPARYDAPLVGVYNPDHRKFGRSFWETGSDRMGDGRHLTIDRTELINEDDHQIRVYFTEGETTDLQYSKDNNSTEYIVPHIEYGHTTGYRDSPYCEVSFSSRIKISDILTQSVCHFAYHVGSNYGPITFSNVDMLAPDRENDLHVSWRDGWHVWGNRYGIMIEDGDYDGGLMYDDIFSPHMVMPKVSEVAGRNVTLISKPGESTEKYTSSEIWQAGDLVSFWNDDQSVYYGMARIVEVADTTRQNLIAFVLDEEVPDINTDTYVINEEAINRDMVIRNCTSTPQGRVIAVRQRTPILYKNCDFKNIHFWIYSGEPWRTRPRHIYFENCVINERLAFNVDDTWNLSIKNCDLSGTGLDLSNVRNVYIDGGNWSGITEPLSLKRSNIHIFGDASIDEEDVIRDGFSSVSLEKPDDYPSDLPPFLPKNEPAVIFVSEPFDFIGTALVGVGSGVGWKEDWQDAQGGGVTVNDSVSLNYPDYLRLNAVGGRIESNQIGVSSERTFEHELDLSSDTFYLSFLAKKNESGEFNIQTNNDNEEVRFGMYVDKGGIATIQSGNGLSSSTNSLFQNDSIYFVLLKYINSKGNNAVTRLKLFNIKNDTIPEHESSIVWDVESDPATTGARQSKFKINVISGDVEIDQIIIGNTYKSVIYDDHYIIEKDTSLAEEDVLNLQNETPKLDVRYSQGGIVVTLPASDGDLYIFDLSGCQIFSGTVHNLEFFLSDSGLTNYTGVLIIRYIVNNEHYHAKILSGE